MDYKESYLKLTEQYIRDVSDLAEALQDLYNSVGGGVKLCGHEFACVCPTDNAKRLIDKFAGH